MSTTFSWGAVGSSIAALGTELNSLAVATLTALGTQIDNTVNNYQLCQVSCHFGSAAFVTGNYIQIFFVPSSDTAGTTYPTFTSAAAAALQNYLAATIYINGSTAVQNEFLTNVIMPLGKFKVLALTGGSCPTLASSGNTVTLYPTPTING
jgi:hypothetical protein